MKELTIEQKINLEKRRERFIGKHATAIRAVIKMIVALEGLQIVKQKIDSEEPSLLFDELMTDLDEIRLVIEEFKKTIQK